MKKKINNNLILYFNNIYPYKSKIITKKKNIVTVGIGGNIGDVSKRFKLLFNMFKSDSRFTIVETSPLLINPPFGYIEQDDFLNGIIVLKTNLSPMESLRAFQRYENRLGRKRSFQDAPRTLDIDIIFFNNLKMNSKKLTLPHHGYKSRDSVLIPLKYINKS
ncbi:MAG: 2-amino-4-hydroxy-6-hydroxymethyldihydropteridine diphosphokinase [Campylobacterota bacterium]|nr:2-amino-4-hydroxy-6-hydroxymethyldihydropteridine diphosphokinase [Campylobacterota bacterium]